MVKLSNSKPQLTLPPGHGHGLGRLVNFGTQISQEKIMKNLNQNLPVVLVLFSILNFSSIASAQGTAFTYQGRVQDNGSPANGTYNLQFLLYTSSAGGSALAGPVTNNAVAVNNGLFTVTI